MIFEGKIFSALLWASRESRNQMVQQSLNLGANGGKPLCRSGDLRARSTSYVQIDRLIRHGIGVAIFLIFSVLFRPSCVEWHPPPISEIISLVSLPVEMMHSGNILMDPLACLAIP